MYKLVAVDLDGTMLNSYGEVSEITKKTIKNAKEKGTEVVIASRKKYRFYYNNCRRCKFI